MTAEELYYELHLLINKNNNNRNINIEKPHFVTLFNREYDKWLYDVLNKKNNDSSINDLQELLVVDLPLNPLQINTNYNIYKLPSNFFNLSEVKISAVKENITKTLFVYNIHPKELNVYLQDEFSKPSFEWEESICIISENNLIVYKDQFEIEQMFLSYYKNSQTIDLAGYTKLDGTMSVNRNLILSSVYQRQILDRVAKELTREFENVQAFQMAQERIV